MESSLEWKGVSLPDRRSPALHLRSISQTVVIFVKRATLWVCAHEFEPRELSWTARYLWLALKIENLCESLNSQNNFEYRLWASVSVYDHRQWCIHHSAAH